VGSSFATKITLRARQSSNITKFESVSVSRVDILDEVAEKGLDGV